MTVTKSDFDPMCLSSQYYDPPEILNFQYEGVRCENYVYRYVLVDKFRPNKIDARSKKTDEEKDLSHKQIAQKYLKCQSHKDVDKKPGILNKIKKVFSCG
tara:strand:- start:828 stop:1127 length:300 start_codon:yes stop_codon:yes gene_type:complete